MTNWIKKRLLERTSFDGAGLIVVGLIILFFGPLASWAAYADNKVFTPFLLEVTWD